MHTATSFSSFNASLVACKPIALLLTGTLAVFLTACGQSTEQLEPAAANSAAFSDAIEATETQSAELLVAQLMGDALIAPPQPTLQISSARSYLNLEWELLENQVSSSVYHYDTLTGEETLVEQFSNNVTNTLSIPSQTHLRAWHREQFRVELCTDDDCVSSQRMSIRGLAPNTVQALTPAVFIENETFADNAVLNANASVLVAALPVAGAIQLFLKPDDQWFTTQQLQLEGLTRNLSRQLQLALSATGDTLAVAIQQDNFNTEIRILERLGEGWLETSSWQLEQAANSGEASSSSSLQAISVEHSLSLSADGNELLIANSGQLYAYQRNTIGWSDYQRFEMQGYTTPSTAGPANEIDGSSFVAFDTSDNMDRIFTVDSTDNALNISIWQRTIDDEGAMTWLRLNTKNLSELDPDRPVILKSNSDGSRIAIAGWEPNSGTVTTPIMWRYSVPEGSSVIQQSVTATDSLRLAPVLNADASLRFDADSSLNTLVIGWQGPVDSTSAGEASLITYRFNDAASRWVSQFEIPETMPTLAKQSFAGLVRLADDGETMIIVSGAGQSLSSNNRVGEIISLH